MFEWDEAKRLRVLADRGLDFRDADLLFDGRPVIHVGSRRNDEDRILSIAEVGGRLHVLVWTWRDGNQRVISLRRAHHVEERAYREIYG
jgi:uncharacterized DUF497 family protein